MDNDLGNFVPESKASLGIISPKESDSQGGMDWKNYLSADSLQKAWEPPINSPYHRYSKTKTISAVEQLKGAICPRYSEGEIRSEQGIQNLIKSGAVGEGVAVVLDSGGPHSVAMAVKLMELGYQPVVMFDNIPHPEGSNHSEQELATLLFFAKKAEMLKDTGKIRPDSPPVFILDTHRSDLVQERVDNNYYYSDRDFPTGQELSRLGILRVVYLNEGDQNGKINSNYQSIDRVGRDLPGVVGNWEIGGIEMVYTGVNPWENSKITKSLSSNNKNKLHY